MAGPEFGPGGYLPPKAAKRARKIVLREQMGWGWPIAAVGAALLVAVAGGIFLLTANSPPGAPFVALAPLSQVEPAGAAVLSSSTRVDVLVVRAGGVVRAFRADADGVAWCSQSRRLETDTAAWSTDGRLVFGDAPSLTPLRSTVFEGTVYVDATSPLPPLEPAPRGQPPVCGGRESPAG